MHIQLLLITRTLPIIALLGFSCSTFAQDLTIHRWQERVLIIKTSNISSAPYLQQLAALERQEESLKERKIVLYKIIGNTVQKIVYQDTTKNRNGAVNGSLQRLSSKIQSPFTILLLGLDGNKKMEQTRSLSATRLYSLIDGMPMRQSEIKTKASYEQ